MVETKPIESELKDLPPLESLVTKISEVTEELKKITKEAIALDIERRTGLPPEKKSRNICKSLVFSNENRHTHN